MQTIHRSAGLLLAGALGLALVGCGGGSDDSSLTTPTEEPTPTPEPTPEPATPEPTPEPTPSAGPDVAAGQAKYATFCASCHGATGNGDGPVSAGLNPKPAKHSDGGYMNPLDDAYLTKVIKLGGPAVGKSPLMAPWGGTLSDADIVNVIAFMRSLADPPYPGS